MGPDDVETAMLKGGGDPSRDTGQVLLALHRVGAAACEAVAKQPLSDEYDLIQTLAKARGAAAVPAVQTVSKGMGPAADGWLKTVLDEAERTSLDLYRACVSKGVPRSVAAHRVGLVYGVPADHLGEYQRKAAEVRTPPPLLVELADEALFGFVAKVADHQPKETVSKAPAAEAERPKVATRVVQDDPTTPYHDARDEQGQFTATPEVGTKATDPRAARAARLAAIQQVNRVNTVNRQNAAERERAKARTVRPATRPVQRERVAGPRVKAEVRRKRIERDLRNMRIAARINSKRLVEESLGNREDPVDPRLFRSAEIPDLLHKDESAPTPNGKLGQEVGWLLLSDEYPALVSEMGRGQMGQMLFRAGPMTEYAHQPVPTKDPDTDTESGRIKEARRGLADRIRGVQGIEHEPEVVDVEDLEGFSSERWDPSEKAGAFDRYVTQLKLEYLREKAARGELPKWATPQEELQHVDILPSTEEVHDDGYGEDEIREQWVLVYHPPQDIDNPLADRGRVNFTELIVDEETRGYRDWSNSKHEDFDVDPNQGFAVTARGASGIAFDPNAKAYRRIVRAKRTSEDDVQEAWERRGGDEWNGGKAMTPERFQQLERTGRVKRDGDGQFTDLQGLIDRAERQYAEEAEQVAPTTADPRAARQARMDQLRRVNAVNRTNATARQARAVPARPQRARLAGGRAQAEVTRPRTRAEVQRERVVTRVALERAVGARAEAEPDEEDEDLDYSLFIPGEEYTVMTRRDAASLKAHAAGPGGLIPRSYQASLLTDWRGAETAETATISAGMEEQFENQATMKPMKRVDFYDDSGERRLRIQQDFTFDDNSAERLAEWLSEEFYEGATYLRVSGKRTLAGGVEVSIWRNSGPTDDVDVIRWNGDVRNADRLQVRQGRNAPALDDGVVLAWAKQFILSAADSHSPSLSLPNPNIQEWIVEPADEPDIQSYGRKLTRAEMDNLNAHRARNRRERGEP